MAQFGWYPKYKNIYQSWNDDGRNHRNHSHMSGRVIIHIGEKSYPGSFSVGHTHVTVRYDGREIVVPKDLGRFTKHIDGRTVYYNAYFDEDSIKTNTTGDIMENDHEVSETNTKNRSMEDEGKTDEKEYGLKNKSNVDEPVAFKVRPEKVGIVDRFITKRSGAIFEKRQHEDKLNELWKEFDETIEKIKSEDKIIKKARTDIPGLEKTLGVAREEWTESLTDLGNLINKTTTHEIGMWDITQKSRRTKGLKVNQKFKDSDIDEIRFNNMMDYIKQYPELQTQKVIERAIQKIDEKRNKIIGDNPTQKELDMVKSSYNLSLDNFEELVGDAEINLNEFEKEIKEAEEKVNNSPYNKGKFGKLGKTTYEIAATRLDLLPYKGKLELRKDKLKRFKDQLSEYKREPLVEINH